jgi:hypothetical protein
MSRRLMREGLSHEWKWSGDQTVFFRKIDETGGWPVGYKFVGFVHSDEREAGFCNSSSNDGWWTVVASADDYYLWKLSPVALQRVADAARNAIRVPDIDASRLWIKSWSGHRASVSSEEQ